MGSRASGKAEGTCKPNAACSSAGAVIRRPPACVAFPQDSSPRMRFIWGPSLISRTAVSDFRGETWRSRQSCLTLQRGAFFKDSDVHHQLAMPRDINDRFYSNAKDCLGSPQRKRGVHTLLF